MRKKKHFQAHSIVPDENGKKTILYERIEKTVDTNFMKIFVDSKIVISTAKGAIKLILHLFSTNKIRHNEIEITNINKNQLAQELNVSRQTIHRWFNELIENRLIIEYNKKYYINPHHFIKGTTSKVLKFVSIPVWFDLKNYRKYLTR